MPMSPGTGAVIGMGVNAIGRGLAGAFPTTTTTNTVGDVNSSGEANSNHNEFSNENLLTWLSQLMSSYNNQNTSQTSTPNLSPEALALISKLGPAFAGLAKPVDLSGYEAGQDQSINANSDLARQSASNIMASRGLATSPVSGTTDANIDAQRFAAINQVHQQIPLLKNQLNLQNLGAAANFMNLIPRGTTTTGVTEGTAGSSTNTQGSQTGSSTSGGTGYTSNQAAQHTDQTQKQKAGGGLGGMLAGFFG